MPEQNETTSPQMRNLGETLTPHKYSATYVREGTQGKKRTVLLIQLRDENDKNLCDHIWVRYNRFMDHLKPGNNITFTATPVRYIKGYSGDNHVQSDFHMDVTLTDIKTIRVLGNNPVIAKNNAEWEKNHPDIVQKQKNKIQKGKKK